MRGVEGEEREPARQGRVRGCLLRAVQVGDHVHDLPTDLAAPERCRVDVRVHAPGENVGLQRLVVCPRTDLHGARGERGEHAGVHARVRRAVDVRRRLGAAEPGVHDAVGHRVGFEVHHELPDPVRAARDRPDLLLVAWRRYVAGERRLRHNVTAADITAVLPDISVEDNQKLAQAAMQLASGLSTVAQLVGSGPTYRKMALRWFVKFAGEQITEGEIAQMIHEGHEEHEG